MHFYRMVKIPDVYFYYFYSTHSYHSYSYVFKQWAIKTCLKNTRSFWLRLMHHKSGWVARALARKKGKV